MRHLVFDRLPTAAARRLTRSLTEGGIPQITGALVSETESVVFDNVQFGLMLRATLSGRSEQITWSATTVSLKKFTVTIEDNPYDKDRNRKNLENEVHRRLMDQIDPVLHTQMDQNL